MTKSDCFDEPMCAGDQQDLQANDELRMRFTGWLETVVKRAKIDYIRRQKRHDAEISFEEATDLGAILYYQQGVSITNNAYFDFENEQAAVAFSKLPPKRSQILTMLFVQNLTPQEIADDLHCSIQHVYNQRSLALKELKHILNKEDE